MSEESLSKQGELLTEKKKGWEEEKKEKRELPMGGELSPAPPMLPVRKEKKERTEAQREQEQKEEGIGTPSSLYYEVIAFLRTIFPCLSQILPTKPKIMVE